MKFGENLKNLRKNQKMTQEELAEKIGVSRQSVSKWENGESYPEMNNIMILCDIFHCKINSLVNDSLIDVDSLDEEIKMSVVKFKKEKQKKMKGLSKAVYIIARICKIAMIIGIGVILLIMIALPFVSKNLNLEDGKILINETIVGTVNDVKAVEVKDFISNHSFTQLIVYAELISARNDCIIYTY
jgi:transcriptional regulator with XRE-family HTH domain